MKAKAWEVAEALERVWIVIGLDPFGDPVLTPFTVEEAARLFAGPGDAAVGPLFRRVAETRVWTRPGKPRGRHPAPKRSR